MKDILIITTIAFSLALGASAQEPAAEGGELGGRVQYALILPEEKTPETVKAEENNPFEAASDGKEDQGSTEEKQVSDIMMALPFQGISSGGAGDMMVMLGGMRLSAGVDVPPILPDQQVKLKVKSVSENLVELVWVEKKPTGLPPKLLVIPIDARPKVRYLMPNGGGSMGTLRPEASSPSAPPPARRTASASGPGGSSGSESSAGGSPALTAGQPSEERGAAKDAVPNAAKSAPPSTPPAANAPEASVLRMLFGGHAPAAK